MPALNKIIPNIAVCALIVLFLLPIAGHIVTPDKEVSVSENRAFQTWPKWSGSLTEYRQDFDSYLNDQFGFRKYAIKTNNRLKLKIDGEQPLVVMGQNDWLFLSEPNLWTSYKGGNINELVIDQWFHKLAELKSVMEKDGAQFFAIIPPNKSRIYPEHAPIKYGAPGEHFIDKLNKDKRAEALNLIDILTPILSEKANGPVYYRTDSHWTRLGAFAAYEALIHEMNQDGNNIPILERKSIRRKTIEAREGDLLKILPESGIEPDTLTVIQTPRTLGFKRESLQASTIHAKAWQTLIYQRENPSKTIVVIGDSFSEALQSALRHSFDKIVIVHHKEGRFKVEEVFDHKPDYILFSPVERFGEKLGTFPKIQPSSH